MRRPRLHPTAAALPLLLLARAGHAQPVPATAACAPTVELGANIPARVAQRLRRVLDHAVGALGPASPCAPSHARLDWNDRELTIHVSLDDGRIAVRSLESLEDVLPTLLSVLAVPPPDPAVADDPPPAPPTPPPVASPAPIVAPPPLAVPVIAPVTAPGSGWSLLVAVGAGASAQAGGDGRWRWSSEVGAATPRIAISARSAMAYSFEGDGRVNPAGGDRRERGAWRNESSVVVSGRARLGVGRLRLEVGGFGGVVHDEVDDADRWSPRVGLEAALAWPFTRSLSALVRAEGFVDLGGERGPGVALSVGVAWEPQR